jgi:hypothetical protein
MSKPNEITGVPDDTWTAKQVAEYEAIKAKSLAELPEHPYWLDEPRVPFDEVIEMLDQLEREAASKESA